MLDFERLNLVKVFSFSGYLSGTNRGTLKNVNNNKRVEATGTRTEMAVCFGKCMILNLPEC